MASQSPCSLGSVLIAGRFAAVPFAAALIVLAAGDVPVRALDAPPSAAHAAIARAAGQPEAKPAPAGPVPAGPAPSTAAPVPDCAASADRLPVSGSLPRTVAALIAHKALRILAIGSSSTEGIGASAPTRSYPARLEVEIERRFPGTDVIVRNAGIGGETIARTSARLAPEVAGFAPDLVIWQVGTNDALSAEDGEARFRSVLDEGIRTLKSRGVDVMLLDPQDFLAIKDRPRYERYVGLVASAAAAFGVARFPRYDVMHSWAAAGPGALEAMLSADRFHMNDAGYACVADLVSRQLERYAESAVGTPVAAAPAPANVIPPETGSTTGNAATEARPAGPGNASALPVVHAGTTAAGTAVAGPAVARIAPASSSPPAPAPR